MGSRVAALAAILAATTMPAGNATAQDAMTPTRIVERSGFGNYADRMEIRLGGMLYDRGLFSPDEYSGAVINGEFLFRSPGFLDVIGSPRPYIGFDAAIADDPEGLRRLAVTSVGWPGGKHAALALANAFAGDRDEARRHARL